MEVQFRSTQNTGLQCLQLTELFTASYLTRFARQICNSPNLGTAKSDKKGNQKNGNQDPFRVYDWANGYQKLLKTMF